LVPDNSLEQLIVFLQHLKNRLDTASQHVRTEKDDNLKKGLAEVYFRISVNVIERREEFLTLSKQCYDLEQDDTKDRIYQTNEQIPMSWYRESQTKTGKELIGLLKSSKTETEHNILLEELLGTRKRRCANWEFYWPEVRSDSTLGINPISFYHALASPFPADATEVEQEHFKQTVEYFAGKINATEAGESGPAGFVESLARLIVIRDLKERIRSGEKPPEAYGIDNVINVLSLCLKSQNYSLIRECLWEFKRICWINLQAAQKIKAILNEYRSTITEPNWDKICTGRDANADLRSKLRQADDQIDKAIEFYSKK